MPFATTINRYKDTLLLFCNLLERVDCFNTHRVVLYAPVIIYIMPSCWFELLVVLENSNVGDKD